MIGRVLMLGAFTIFLVQVEVMAAERLAMTRVVIADQDDRPRVSSYSVPGLQGMVLTVAYSDSRNPGNYGLRITVSRDGQDIFASRGMNDVEFVEPEFFVGGEAVLMVANMGAEDSWGLVVLELSEEGVQDLDGLEVAAPRKDLGDYLKSALPFLSVYRGGGTYQMELGTNLVLEPGAQNERFLKAGESPFIFSWNGSSWTLAGEGSPAEL